MTTLNTNLQAAQLSFDCFVSAVEAVPEGRWLEPRAPGKWSSAQVAEHVALTLEVNRALFQGAAPGGAPRFLRPLMRLGFNWVLRKGRFPRGSRSPAVMRPGEAPAAQSAVVSRLQAAATAFAAAAVAHVGPVEHPFFGQVSLADFVHLQEIHTRHHQAQLVTAA